MPETDPPNVQAAMRRERFPPPPKPVDLTGSRTPEHLLFLGYGGMLIVDAEILQADFERLEAENDEPEELHERIGKDRGATPGA